MKLWMLTSVTGVILVLCIVELLRRRKLKEKYAFLWVLTGLVIIPLGAAAVISLLVVLPSMARGDRGYQAGQPWRGESEWFGGPTKGVRTADEVTPEQVEARSQGTGGTSASW